MNQSSEKKTDPGQHAIFVKEITNIDFAVFEPSLGIEGHSYHVDLLVAGELNEQGYITEFGDLKKMVKELLKETIDHSLVIPISSSQGVHYTETEKGDRWRLHASSRLSGGANFTWEYFCPKSAVFPLRSVSIRSTHLEQEIVKLLRHRVTESVHSIQVRLREEELEPTQAVFRYTHGIASHQGLCQRIFHGHRSRIEVFVSEERRPDCEQFIARELFGGSIHIATPSQIKSGHIEMGQKGKCEEPITLSYISSHGLFEATLPGDRVFLVEDETSIECIALFLAKLMKKKLNTSHKVKVIAFEGIGKGSIAEV